MAEDNDDHSGPLSTDGTNAESEVAALDDWTRRLAGRSLAAEVTSRFGGAAEMARQFGAGEAARVALADIDDRARCVAGLDSFAGALGRSAAAEAMTGLRTAEAAFAGLDDPVGQLGLGRITSRDLAALAQLDAVEAARTACTTFAAFDEPIGRLGLGRFAGHHLADLDDRARVLGHSGAAAEAMARLSMADAAFAGLDDWVARLGLGRLDGRDLAGEIARQFGAAEAALAGFDDRIQRLASGILPQETLSTGLTSAHQLNEHLQRLIADHRAADVAFASPVSGALALAGTLGRFAPDVVAGRMLADAAITSASAEGTLRDILGHSFVIDAVAEASALEAERSRGDRVDELALKAIQRLLRSFRYHLASVQNVPQLQLYISVFQLVATAIMLWLAWHAPTSEDTAAQTAAEERQTEIMERRQADEAERRKREEERREIERQQLDVQKEIAKALDEVLRKATEKACELPRATLYRVKRSVAVKADQKMNSETIYVLEVGEIIALSGSDKKWAKIEFFDQLTGISSSGWVLKKYLRRVQR